jgi:hypothetical protein
VGTPRHRAIVGWLGVHDGGGVPDATREVVAGQLTVTVHGLAYASIGQQVSLFGLPANTPSAEFRIEVRIPSGRAGRSACRLPDRAR